MPVTQMFGQYWMERDVSVRCVRLRFTSAPFAHRFDTWILFSSHKMSSQHSDRISDARSAVAAQVSTSAKCSELVRDLSMAIAR